MLYIDIHETLSLLLYVYSRYVMLDGVNDSPSEARDLVRLLRQLPSHVNLM